MAETQCVDPRNKRETTTAPGATPHLPRDDRAVSFAAGTAATVNAEAIAMHPATAPRFGVTVTLPGRGSADKRPLGRWSGNAQAGDQQGDHPARVVLRAGADAQAADAAHELERLDVGADLAGRHRGRQQ